MSRLGELNITTRTGKLTQALSHIRQREGIDGFHQSANIQKNRELLKELIGLYQDRVS